MLSTEKIVFDVTRPAEAQIQEIKFGRDVVEENFQFKYSRNILTLYMIQIYDPALEVKSKTPQCGILKRSIILWLPLSIIERNSDMIAPKFKSA